MKLPICLVAEVHAPWKNMLKHVKKGFKNCWLIQVSGLKWNAKSVEHAPERLAMKS